MPKHEFVITSRPKDWKPLPIVKSGVYSSDKLSHYSSLKGHLKTKLSCSKKTRSNYRYLEPFAVDLETGEIINNSREPKLVYVGEINVYDQIQSYRDECDIYAILKRCVQSGDMTLLDRKVGAFSDIVGMPTNIHEFYDKLGEELKTFNKMPSDIARMVLDKNVKTEDITEAISREVNRRLEEFKKQMEVKDNG